MSIEAYEDNVRDRLKKTYAFDDAHLKAIADAIGPLIHMAHCKGRPDNKVADAIALQYPKPCA